MVAEVTVHHWCDRHVAEGAGKREARQYVLDVGAGRREVDLCEECVEALLAPLAEVLGSVSRPADTNSTATAPRQATQQALALDSAVFVCPLCDARLASWGSLTGHFKGKHDMTPSAVYGSACALCGEEFTNTGAHVSRSHGVPSAAEAFARADGDGDPHGVVARRRYVWADLRRQAAA